MAGSSQTEAQGGAAGPLDLVVRKRWTICALLFFATTLNYLDRQIIGVLKPVIQADMGWSELDYASIVLWFQLAYAIGLISVGRLLDVVGVRWGYFGAVAMWSMATMAHGLMRSVSGFAFARGWLGVAEAANFPAAVKSVKEWFPKSERALATGIFNAGANVGVIISVLLIPPIVLAWDWRAAFFVSGGLGLLWMIAWLSIYRARGPFAQAEVAAGERPLRWVEVIRLRQTWAYAAGKFMTDPIWWFFLFWLPDFLGKTQGLDLKTFGPPLLVIYIAADIGSVGGGALSSWLLTRGWSVNAARKTAMLICAVCVVPVIFAATTSSLWVATGLIALAAAAHQGWSANLLTLPADSVPNSGVASVVGFGGMMGAFGGMLMAGYTGWVLQTTGSYTGLFAMIGGTYLVSLLVIHLLAPRIGEQAGD